MLDYIKYSKRASFDIKQYIDTVNKIGEESIKVYIHGRVIVPESITTKQVYMNVGSKYYYSFYSKKHTYYNGSKTHQQAEYFLADTKTDTFGNGYVDYKISLIVDKPWKEKVSSVIAPNTYFFKIAPKTRGFKNKFEKADIYVLDE